MDTDNHVIVIKPNNSARDEGNRICNLNFNMYV